PEEITCPPYTGVEAYSACRSVEQPATSAKEEIPNRKDTILIHNSPFSDNIGSKGSRPLWGALLTRALGYFIADTRTPINTVALARWRHKKPISRFNGFSPEMPTVETVPRASASVHRAEAAVLRIAARKCEMSRLGAPLAFLH